MAQTWEQNPMTGDYVMQGGAPVETNSLRMPAYVRLKVRRSTWLYAPNTEYGSEFHTVKKRKTNDDASLIENLAARALQPILDDGRAAAIEIDTEAVSRNGVGIKSRIIVSEGESEVLLLPQIP